MIRILQQDNRITKAIFAVIIGAAIITMVIALVPGIFDNGDSGDATVYATVHAPGIFGKFVGDSRVIKMDAVNRTAQMQLQQRGYPATYLPYFIPQAGQSLIARAIMSREADRLGLGVSDADLKNELQHGQYANIFFPNGQFIGELAYENMITSQAQMSVADFETEVKTDMELHRLQSLVTGGVAVSDAAVRDAILKDGTKVKFDYAVLSAADVMKTLKPSDEELEAFFKQNARRYATASPETRKIEFFSFDASNLPGGKPQISDADIQAYYDAHQAQYKVDDQIQTRHILIQVAKGADAKTDAAAKAKAEDVLKQLKAGGNFAELAKKYSDDPGSKDKGGELPMMSAKQLVPAYSNAAMALNPGQTSDLVRSEFGYHIIQTIKKESAHLKPLSEVKDTIVPVLMAQRSGAAEQAFANQLATEAQKNGMQKTADAHGLHITSTDYIPQNGVIGTLADSSTLLKQAFATAKGAAPTTAATGEGFAVFQVDDVKPAHAPEFAEIKARVLNDYLGDKVGPIIEAQMKKLGERAKVLGDLKKAAAELNIPLKTSDLVGKDAQVPSLGSMAEAGAVAFTLPKGGISGPIQTTQSIVILQVTDKQEPTSDDIAKGFTDAREKLLNDRRQEVFGTYAQTLLARYEKAGAITSSQKKTPTSPFGK